MKHIGLVLLCGSFFVAGCASDGSTTLSIGMGSFGGSGGVGGSVSTTVPTGGTDDQTPLPYEQIYLANPVIEELFPQKTLPFTADTRDVKALTEYSADTEDGRPGLGDKNLERLAKCQNKKAQCRIQRAE